MGRLRCDNTYTSLAANRTREIRPSGMRGRLAETWAMGELGTHLAMKRASVGTSPPKVIRAALLPDVPARPLVARRPARDRAAPGRRGLTGRLRRRRRARYTAPAPATGREHPPTAPQRRRPLWSCRCPPHP